MCDTLAEAYPKLVSIDAATANQDEPTTNPQACLNTIQLRQSIMSDMDALAKSHSSLLLPNFLEPLSPELEPSPIKESSPSEKVFGTFAQVRPFETANTSHTDYIEPICFKASHSGQENGSSRISTYLLDGIGHILMSDSSSDQSDVSGVTNTKLSVDECRSRPYAAESNLPQKLEPIASNESGVAQEGQRKTRRWEERFDELECFKAKNGHCNVTAQNSQHFPKLLQWIKQQRYHFKSQYCAGLPGVLTKERAIRMESLGFVWNTHCEKWENNFAELELYARQYGHCNVPRNPLHHSRLARWVKRQRRCYVTKSLESASSAWRASASSGTFGPSRPTSAACAEDFDFLGFIELVKGG